MFDQLHISTSATDWLVTGQHLDRAEFERRWELSPQIKYAELIDGIVRVGGPVKAIAHARPHARLAMWLGCYEAETEGVFGSGPSSIRFDNANMPLPDALLMIDPQCGGRCRISDDDILEGGPELICEVTTDSTSFDLRAKFYLYERYGVQEYLIWRSLDRALDWFQLGNGGYQRLVPQGGLLKSTAFPGLWLNPEDLMADRMRSVRETLRQSTSLPEHSAFVQRLQR